MKEPGNKVETEHMKFLIIFKPPMKKDKGRKRFFKNLSKLTLKVIIL